MTPLVHLDAGTIPEKENGPFGPFWMRMRHEKANMTNLIYQNILNRRNYLWIRKHLAIMDG